MGAIKAFLELCSYLVATEVILSTLVDIFTLVYATVSTAFVNHKQRRCSHSFVVTDSNDYIKEYVDVGLPSPALKRKYRCTCTKCGKVMYKFVDLSCFDT